MKLFFAAVVLALTSQLSAEENLTPLFQEDEEGNFFFEGKPVGRHESLSVSVHHLTMFTVAFGKPANWEEENPGQPENLAHAALFLVEEEKDEARHYWVVSLWEPTPADNIVDEVGQHLVAETKQRATPRKNCIEETATASVVKQMEADSSAVRNCVICITLK